MSKRRTIIPTGVIGDAMRRRGYKSMRELATATGINYVTMCLYFRVYSACPRRKHDGAFRTLFVDVCDHLGMLPEDAFPGTAPVSMTVPWPAQQADAGVRSGLLLAVSSPADDLQARERTAAVRHALNVLTTRERDVIAMRFFDGLTLTEVSKVIGKTRERVRQIEAKAMWRLRHPARISKLREAFAS